MKTFLYLALSALLLTATAGAQTMSSRKKSQSGSAKFSALCDRFVKDSLALSPVGASQAGYHKHIDPKTGKTIALDAELDDVGAAAVAAQVQFYRHWRSRSQTEAPGAALNSEDAADFRLIDDQIALALLE